MDNTYLTSRGISAKKWHLFLILGFILVVVSLWTFLTPVLGYIGLTALFSSAFLATGIVEIAYALSNRNRLYAWGWSLAEGIFDLLIGLLLILTPNLSMSILIYYIGFGIILRSSLAIAWSMFLKGAHIKDWSNLLLIGITGILFSFISMWKPWFAGLTSVIYSGLAFLLVGTYYIYLSFKLKK